MTLLRIYPVLILDTLTSSTVMVCEEDLNLFLWNVLGVLHHLQEPLAALAILASLLKEDGGMQLMVYAW